MDFVEKILATIVVAGIALIVIEKCFFGFIDTDENNQLIASANILEVENNSVFLSDENGNVIEVNIEKTDYEIKYNISVSEITVNNDDKVIYVPYMKE